VPPADFAKLSAPAMQRGGTLRSLGGFAPHPVAPVLTDNFIRSGLRPRMGYSDAG
jgi:hypothetical protein